MEVLCLPQDRPSREEIASQMGVSAKHLEDEGLFGLVYKSCRFADRLPALPKTPQKSTAEVFLSFSQSSTSTSTWSRPTVATSRRVMPYRSKMELCMPVRAAAVSRARHVLWSS